MNFIWEDPEKKVHGDISQEAMESRAQYIVKALNLKKTDCVLDIGCGEGLTDYYIKEKCGKLKGIDFAKSRIAEAKKRNPECDYFEASFLENYKEKCQNVNKVFSDNVMQYCKPEDTYSFLRNSIAVLGKECGELMHFDVPDFDRGHLSSL